MRRSELGDLNYHHLPRPHKKVKRHTTGFSEDAAEARQARSNFKNYLRELKEAEASNALDGTRPLTEADKEFLIADFQRWSAGAAPGECEESELRAYALSEAPVELDSQEVLDFLKGLANERD